MGPLETQYYYLLHYVIGMLDYTYSGPGYHVDGSFFAPAISPGY